MTSRAASPGDRSKQVELRRPRPRPRPLISDTLARRVSLSVTFTIGGDLLRRPPLPASCAGAGEAPGAVLGRLDPAVATPPGCCCPPAARPVHEHPAVLDAAAAIGDRPPVVREPLRVGDGLGRLARREPAEVSAGPRLPAKIDERRHPYRSHRSVSIAASSTAPTSTSTSWSTPSASTRPSSRMARRRRLRVARGTPSCRPACSMTR